MGIDPAEAVVTVGPPDNFATFTGDLWSVVFHRFDIAVEDPDGLSQRPLALISVPETEGARAAWIPVTCGHELSHFLQSRRAITYVGMPPLNRAALTSTVDSYPLASREPRARALEQIAANWLLELSCDAYALHRFGPAAVVALTDFLSFASPESAAGSSHPPRALRTKLLLRWLDKCVPGDELGIADRASFASAQDTALPDWAKVLSIHYEASADAIWDSIKSWCGVDAYGDQDRTEIVKLVSEQLKNGIPGTETVSTEAGVNQVIPADIVNAVWLSFETDNPRQVNRLALKALDSLDFLEKWRVAGEKTDGLLDVEIGDASGIGALTGPQIAARVASDETDRLTVTPLLPGGIGRASLDLRLGNRFIVFEHSGAAAFDALDQLRDPRTMQTEVEKAWGDVFYLHPGQLVLAASLEYLVMPADLTGQVITRSSYGRLGLLSATAVQVHPRFSGCLTFELVNLGDMPMAITPGERVAQLMLWTTTSHVPESDHDKYRNPTGPEFSKIRADEEAEVIRVLRRQFRRPENK